MTTRTVFGGAAASVSDIPDEALPRHPFTGAILPRKDNAGVPQEVKVKIKAVNGSTPTTSRSDHEAYVRGLSVEAFAAAPVEMEEAFAAVVGGPALAWSAMTRVQLHTLGRIALRICLQARG